MMNKPFTKKQRRAIASLTTVSNRLIKIGLVGFITGTGSSLVIYRKDTSDKILERNDFDMGKETPEKADIYPNFIRDSIAGELYLPE